MSDLISREDAREAIEDLMDIHFDRQVVLAKARDAIVSLPSAVCDDCIWHVCNYNKVDWDGEDGYISRQDAIDIVDQFSREEMFHYMESLELDVRATQICHSAIEAVGTIKEQIKSLPSAEPKTKYVAQIRIDRDDMEDLVNKKVNEIVDNMAEPKTGKWVLKEHLWECDKCGCRINRANPLKGNIWNYNYCPNCGADMRGEGK